MLTIIIPFRNEENNLLNTVKKIRGKINSFKSEIILINDYSNDNSFNEALKISKEDSNVIILNNEKKGLGGAIQLGIDNSNGDFVTIMMADACDDINDLTNYYNIISNENIDAVFGTRFSKDSKLENYPKGKLVLNRIFNYIVKLLFLSDYNDFTNAFKIYKKSTLKNLQPITSESFNIFLELPLKIIIGKYKYKIISINWIGRSIGKSKFIVNKLLLKYFITLTELWFKNLKKNK
tara:strand:- start:2212 stop:2919 length:708 start_codon:yes stop_codon:yes gene_type:complete